MSLSFENIDMARSWFDGLLPHQRAQVESVAGRAQKTLYDGLLKKPLLRQYVRHLAPREGYNPRNNQPWHALGERLYWAFTACTPGVEWVDGAERPIEDHKLAPSVALRLVSAQVYLLMDNARLLARAMPDLPRHTISRSILQHPGMFFSMETAVVFPDGREGNMMFISDDGGEGVLVMHDMTSVPSAAPRFILGRINYGMVYPDDFGEEQAKAAGDVLKLLAFLQSNAPDIREERLLRAERRRLTRAGVPAEEVEQTVAVVRLRAVEQEPRGGDGEEAYQNRLHHWWVRGHWRAQWYPSEKAHRCIWIEPHIKGDISKPLLDKVYTVDR